MHQETSKFGGLKPFNGYAWHMNVMEDINHDEVRLMPLIECNIETGDNLQIYKNLTQYNL